MSGEQTLHFTFGPVQGFIAQARRTRDFWASSYLLSYLAAAAMCAVEQARGEITVPAAGSAPLLQRLRGAGQPDADRRLAETVGSLPNRFTATVPSDFDGGSCQQALCAAWARVTDAVWEYLGLPETIRKRWDRQVMSFWDCTWVIGAEHYALDQRKHLRTHLPPAEPGEKCTLCGERQELSGLGLGSAASRDQMRQWWQARRGSLPQGDLGADERLCAVCLVKRLFPRVATRAIGWQVPVHFPSVAYVAAVDWLRHALTAAPAAAAEYARTARRLGVAVNAGGALPPGLASLATEPDQKTFLALDGNAFFADAIRSDDPDDSPVRDPAHRSQLAAALEHLQRETDAAAHPFYALLVMDGDGMGKLLSSVEPRGQVSAALRTFSAQVPAAVSACNGFLIYAGGDDVVALLPVDQALACAARCRRLYRDAFAPLVANGAVLPDRATISAAVLFAHVKTPLRSVIRDAHHLLDDVAKDATGRDALACQVCKRGGPVLTWTQPWAAICQADDSLTIDAVQRAFREARVSSKLFYKARDLFGVLAPAAGEPMPEDAQEKVMAAEYLADRELTWPPRSDGTAWTAEEKQAEAMQQVRALLDVCRTRRRSVDGEQPAQITPGGLDTGGLLLVRFLTRKEA